MIVSHAHRFVFVKTRKTAGSSIEIALSRHCGERDLITHLDKRGEALRAAEGGVAPQNHLVPIHRMSPAQWYRFLRMRRRVRAFHGWYDPHEPARVIRQRIGAGTWDDYFTFCFERNPWDKAISFYHWITTEYDVSTPLPEFVLSPMIEEASDWDTYAIDGEVAVDFVGRYERLAEDLAFVWDRLGLPGEPDLPRAKAHVRTDRRPWAEVLGPAQRERIARVFAREIEAFGYAFDDPAGGEA